MKIKIPAFERLERLARRIVKDNRQVQRFLARKEREVERGLQSGKFTLPQAKELRRLMRAWKQAIVNEAMYKILKGYDVGAACSFNRAH